MAFFDDAEWLQSHIVNSFITSDDTGVCELVMTVESAESLAAGDAAERDTYFEPHSPEIVMDMDIGGHRRRSNTSQRLDKLKKERKNAARVKNVIWQPNPDPLPDADRNFLFEKKPIVRHAGPKPSLLTEHLNMLDLSDNPYTEYSKFDGRAHAGVPTRRINIFLTMAPAEELAFPMSVTVVASARVSDVIGLICWQYTNEDREPPLRGSPEMYSLHIAEDDGEVDWDFPPLDDRETVAKFGFNVLALVETEQTEVTEPGRTGREGPGDALAEEAKRHGGGDAERRVGATAGRGPRDSAWQEAQGRSRGGGAQLQRPDVGHGGHRVPVVQGISGDRVEIDPVQVRSTLNVSKFLSKPRAVTYQIDSIMECRLWEVKYGGRAIVRLTYLLPSDGGYRHHDLEADLGTAKDIVRKLEYILEFRSGMSRKTYLQQKEKRSLLASLAAK
ncbi:target of rapamycin complex 2 subunit MAPKAP1-like isoform X4 [Pollicipes pollicipes]|uniref:target of rapamycin complex 2 subunit MAPKAP1-like isoform X4 n=1 Tax=Pollicipes pollicipes TaxID=41117 RepID=UPI0018859F39|nr:target of rapamycin complex 2 subunit MAPKAP1-like isoform X4 [Pollicipes pollicipes]